MLFYQNNYFALGRCVREPQVYEKLVFTACKNPTVTKHVWLCYGFLHAVNTSFSYTCG